MKSRFNTIDITAVIRELLRFVSMRVMNVYDVDNKTYLIRLGKPDDKAVIVLESGIKIHSTEFEWPKNPAPSGFSMKMRKHLKGRRLESVRQLGVDRIIDMAFGSGEAAYHVILELYDRGNIVLTDFTYTILNILRPRTDTSQDVRFAVRETYPLDAAKQHELPTEERLRELILTAKPGDTLKKVLIPHLDYGPAVIEHCLIGAGFPENVKIGKGFNMTTDMGKLLIAIEEAEDLLNIIQTQPCRGYITQKCEKRAAAKEGERTELLTYDEFHPMLFRQLQNKQNLEFDTFNKAVDEFYSQTESQKIELKTLQQEKAALKKLDNVKKDHEKRVEGLQKEQEGDKMKGQLIEMNLGLVDKAIQVVRSAIANQIDWTEIKNLVKEAQMDDDPVAMAIKELKLDTNHIILLLQNPYVDSDFEEGEEDIVKPMRVDINLGLSAYSNSRKYFEMKKYAAVKEQKTMDASVKALKSAERKAKETLKDVATAASINKARKTYWFEKFLWFISSENFLVIGGRDQQQNELLVKRYMKSVDTYVHADLHGASTVIIKNSTGSPVPPKTLNEAGTMAICNSAAWDAKVVTSAWWVYPSQVTKTAPSGEYLTTGSFMIRGKKNYLPPSYLIYGFGFLFKLEEGSVPRHAGERRVRTAEEDEMSIADSTATEVESVADSEITLGTNTDEDDDDDSEDESEVKPGQNDEDTDADKQETCVDTDVIITEPVLIKDEENIRSMSSHNSEENEKQSARDDVADTECDSADTEKTGDQSGDGEAPVTGNIGTPVEFPDTEISLQHVKGDKYELLRTRSDSNQSTEPAMDIIYLGDSMPVVLGEKTQSVVRLSAKQKREMKKAKKQTQWITTDDKQDKDGCQESIAEEQKNADIEKKTKQTSPKQQQEQQTQQQEQQPKRRQKAKLKKMKEKYGDQDAEERQLRMEILASAGVKKEDKKKKGKKGDDKGRPASTQNQNRKQPYDGLRRKPELVDIIIQDVADLTTDAVGMKADSPQEQQIKEPQPPVDGEEERQEDETQTGSDDSQVLTSLTGCPVTEDELLYAMPVCAPYNALINYKYKVKLLPGSTKRGKAAKTALNTHLLDKNVTSREKDLLKILKDVDMARNIPGKAKVAAPNLHKGKKK